MTKKNIGLSILILFNLCSLLYLILPLPSVPDLPSSLKSIEPGDTVQIPNVNAYYTDQSRSEVMNFYYHTYKFPFVIHLNHPPERAKIIFKDTIQSYYLEELVIPFKASLFINGFEWQNDVFTPADKRAANKLMVGTQTFNAKITTRTFSTSIPARLFSFFTTEMAILYTLYIAKKYVFTAHL